MYGITKIYDKCFMSTFKCLMLALSTILKVGQKFTTSLQKCEFNSL